MLEKTLAFTEARNRMLAENVANITTPGFSSKQLDVAAFQNALREASDQRERPGDEFVLPSTEQFRDRRIGAAHELDVTPTAEPVENLLFHDGTNARIEKQMAYLAENAMMHQAAAELLKVYFDGIDKAIRGRLR